MSINITPPPQTPLPRPGPRLRRPEHGVGWSHITIHIDIEINIDIHIIVDKHVADKSVHLIVHSQNSSNTK